MKKKKGRRVRQIDLRKNKTSRRVSHHYNGGRFYCFGVTASKHFKPIIPLAGRLVNNQLFVFRRQMLGKNRTNYRGY